MSDPLSIAASVAGFLSLAIELTKILSGFIGCVKSAPKGARDLLTEITALCSVLNQLTILLGKEAQNQGHFNQESVLSAIVQLCGEEIGGLRRMLDKHQNGKRLIESLKWPFKVDECQQTVDKLHRLVQTIEFSLQVANYNLLSDSSSTVLARLEEEKHKILAVLSIVTEVSQSTTELNDMLRGMKNMMQTKFEGDDLNDIMQWLSPLEPHQRHADIATQRLPNTGEWFLQLEDFKDWCDSDIEGDSGMVFTCYGIPGAGKTMISSVIIDYLTKNAGQGDKNCVSCLYFDYRDEVQRHLSPVNMVGALLKQALSTFSAVPNDVIDALKKKRKEFPVLTLPGALELLQIALENFDTTYICIDALDECKDEYQMEFLRSISKILNPSTKVFITARHTVKNIIDKNLIRPSTITITMELEANPSDIRMFIADKISKDAEDMEMTDEFKEEIMETILSSTGGMFLLPALQIQTVLDETTVKKRRKALKTMPKELTEAYGGIIERIRRQSKGRVRQAMEVLKWTFLSERPLSTIELRHALSVTPKDTDFDIEDLPTENSLINCCLGLVTIVVKDGVPTVRLVHKSLQEYFESEQEILFRNGHREIAMICFTYIGFRFADELKDLDFIEVLEYLEFLEYAVFTWGYHVKEQYLEPADEKFAVSVLKRNFEVPGFSPSEDSEDNDSNSQNHIDEGSRLYIWKYFVVKPKEPFKHWQLSWIHLQTQWNSKTPLHLLFNNNIGIQHLEAGNEFGLTAFMLAVEFQHPETVELFLQRSDINFNAANDTGRRALHLIIGSRDHDINAARRVVELLLQRPDIEVNCQTISGKSPLHQATKFEMELLLKRPDINVNIRNIDGETPLFRADTEMARMLLEREDTNVNVQKDDGMTPLIRAIMAGNIDIVDMLVLRRDLDPNLQNRSSATSTTGATPLYFATVKANIDIMNLLFERPDLDVNCGTVSGSTPLHVACSQGKLPVIQKLLEHPEINVNAQDLTNMDTPVHVALKRGHHDVAKILLEHPDIDVYCENFEGETPLSLATSLGIDFVVVDRQNNKPEYNSKSGGDEEGSPEDEVSLHSGDTDMEATEPELLEGASQC